MSRTCTICGKSAARANHVSHSNIKVPRHQKPNLQKISLSGVKTKACSTCRRSIKKKLSA